jgi:hypothetical protein
LRFLHEVPFKVILLQRAVFTPFVKFSALLPLSNMVESYFVLKAVLDVLQFILELNCER